jgi:hypothetical protein
MGMWLNVGCGPHRAPRPWHNVDRVRREGNTEPDEVVGDTLPYPDGTVTRLYAGHILEHVPLPGVAALLADWIRVMHDSGHLAVVGPDVNRALELFRTGRLGRDELWERMEHGTTTSLEAWRRLYGATDIDPHARHHWNCIPERVIALLETAGFEKVREIPIASPELNDWPLVGRAEDQFAVLAVKP